MSREAAITPLLFFGPMAVTHTPFFRSARLPSACSVIIVAGADVDGGAARRAQRRRQLERLAADGRHRRRTEPATGAAAAATPRAQHGGSCHRDGADGQRSARLSLRLRIDSSWHDHLASSLGISRLAAGAAKACRSARARRAAEASRTTGARSPPLPKPERRTRLPHPRDPLRRPPTETLCAVTVPFLPGVPRIDDRVAGPARPSDRWSTDFVTGVPFGTVTLTVLPLVSVT